MLTNPNLRIAVVSSSITARVAAVKVNCTVKCGILSMLGVTPAHCKMMHVRQLTGDMVSGNEVTQTVKLLLLVIR